jgi:hypothetical protein
MRSSQRARRIPLCVEVAYRLAGEETWQRGQILNVSESGVLFAPASIEPGREIEVSFSAPFVIGSLPSGRLVCEAHVVRSSGGGAAAEFDDWRLVLDSTASGESLAEITVPVEPSGTALDVQIDEPADTTLRRTLQALSPGTPIRLLLMTVGREPITVDGLVLRCSPQSGPERSRQPRLDVQFYLPAVVKLGAGSVVERPGADHRHPSTTVAD